MRELPGPGDQDQGRCVRGFRLMSPRKSPAEKIRAVQEFGLELGVMLRVAEIIESDIVALQLNRVARESGTDKVLRRFWDEDAAHEWLLHGDSEQPALFWGAPGGWPVGCRVG